MAAVHDIRAGRKRKPGGLSSIMAPQFSTPVLTNPVAAALIANATGGDGVTQQIIPPTDLNRTDARPAGAPSTVAPGGLAQLLQQVEGVQAPTLPRHETAGIERPQEADQKKRKMLEILQTIGHVASGVGGVANSPLAVSIGTGMAAGAGDAGMRMDERHRAALAAYFDRLNEAERGNVDLAAREAELGSKTDQWKAEQRRQIETEELRETGRTTRQREQQQHRSEENAEDREFRERLEVVKEDLRRNRPMTGVERAQANAANARAGYYNRRVETMGKFDDGDIGGVAAVNHFRDIMTRLDADIKKLEAKDRLSLGDRAIYIELLRERRQVNTSLGRLYGQLTPRQMERLDEEDGADDEDELDGAFTESERARRALEGY